MSLTEKQAPYTGPYGLSTSTNKSKGPTVEALKRALSRAGAPSLPWQEFDQHYNVRLEDAWDWYDRKVGAGITNNGYAKGRWERLRSMRADPGGQHAGEYALDQYGRTLIQNEAGLTSDSDELTRLQKYITEFVKAAIANEPNWHYDMSRPVRLDISPTAAFVKSDCSGFVIQSADYARRWANLFGSVVDPSKYHWSGYGNTDDDEDGWPHVSAPYRVGDLAHFANERHVIICYKEGDRTTALWGSHGREGGPESVNLSTYRVNDFMFVVRPDYLPPAV